MNRQENLSSHLTPCTKSYITATIELGGKTEIKGWKHKSWTRPVLVAMGGIYPS
jgi:hypothetical protein